MRIMYIRYIILTYMIRAREEEGVEREERVLQVYIGTEIIFLY